MPLIVPPVVNTGILRYEIIDPLGATRDFSRDSSPRMFIPAGSIGLGTATYTLEENKLPVNAGTYLRQINTNSRIMHIPVVITETSFGNLLLKVDDLHKWFDTGDENRKSPLYLRVTRPDDTIRQVLGYYSGGLEGNLGEGSPTFVKYIIDLLCPDPAPTDSSNTVLTKTVAQAALFGVINQGQLNAYPIWKLTGPFTNVDLLNVTTGGALSVIISILAGHYIIIDTRPSDLRNVVSVYDDLGANKTINVHPASKFWTLASGMNNVSVTFTSGTTSATSVELTYLARYRGILR